MAVVFVFPEEGGHLRTAFGHGTRLVQHDGVYPSCTLQAFGVLDKDASFGSLADAHHDGCRCGQPQGAGTGDDEHRHQCQQAVGEAVGWSQQYPAEETQQGNGHDGGNEDTCNTVRQLLHRSFAALCILYGTDDVGQQCVVSHLLGAEYEAALLVDGTRQYTVACALAHGQRFAAQHAFVYVRLAAYYRAVHGHAFAGLH